MVIQVIVGNYFHLAHLFNKFADVVPIGGLGNLTGPIRFRNIKIGRPAIAHRLHVGKVARFEGRTFIHISEGRKTHTWCSSKRVRSGHTEGRDYFAFGCIFNHPFPNHWRIVCIDIRRFRWSSIDSLVFHSFVWPRNVKEAKGIVVTLFINHCDWVDVLIVRGRCFSSSKLSFRADRVLESLLLNWSKMQWPCVVYQEGSGGIVGSDFLPAWLTRECVHKDVCQCRLVGPRHPN